MSIGKILSLAAKGRLIFKKYLYFWQHKKGSEPLGPSASPPPPPNVNCWATKMYFFLHLTLRESSLKKHTHIFGPVSQQRGGGGCVGVSPNPNLLNGFIQVTEINCPNSKTKCTLQNNSITMTTYDFSIKSVLGYLE